MVKGRIAGRTRPRDPYRQLLAEMLVAAIEDARRGDVKAREWLLGDGREAFAWLDVALPAGDLWLGRRPGGN